MKDFWKMIVDYEVSAIVMLCGMKEGSKVCLNINSAVYLLNLYIFSKNAINIGVQTHLVTIKLKQFQARIVLDT